jgi:peptide/nickel transport system substrate-binding protein
MFKTTRASKLLVTGLAMSLMTLGIGLLSANAGASRTKASANWTINLANFAPASANFAYPLMDIADFTQSNGSFQQLTYRPLYWFGTSTGAVDVNKTLSLANLPVMSKGNRTATITMKKGYKWSNGQSVQANDVMEFMNLFAAYPSWYGAYGAPVNGHSVTIPDLIQSMYAPNTSTIVMNFTHPVSPHWLVFNPLSEVTPLPKAWDVVAANWIPGSAYTPTTRVSTSGGNIATKAGGCWSKNFIGDGNTTGPTKTYVDPNSYQTIIHANKISLAKRCTEVIATMASFANNVTNYANPNTVTGRMWGLTDGPWKLKTFNPATAAMSWVRNPGYGGAKAYAKVLNYIPCQSATGDCYNLLLSGKVTAGNVPSSFAANITSLSQAKNAQIAALAKNYNLHVNFDWAIGYSPMNFNSANTGAQDQSSLSGDTTPRSALLAQPYIDRALNDSYPATTIINTAYRGYAYATFGPIPPYPVNSFTTLKSSPYTLAKTTTEMSAHGWTLVNGIYTCTSPGSGASQCGAHIGNGATMTFRVDAAVAGDTQGQGALTTWVSAAKTVGINLLPNIGTFTQVIAKDTSAATNWDIYTGSGWIYAPDFYPSGEALFLTGAPSNSSSYSNAKNDSNIIGTLTGAVSLDTYERFLTDNPPVVWNFWVVRLGEVQKNVGGWVHQATGYATPELWYSKK